MNETGTNTAVNWQKKTALFLSSQTVSLFGSSLVQYAINLVCHIIHAVGRDDDHIYYLRFFAHVCNLPICRRMGGQVQQKKK